MSEKKAIIFDLQRNSCVDGPGIRTTVFFKGCNYFSHTPIDTALILERNLILLK